MGGLTAILYHTKHCAICNQALMQWKKAAEEYPSVQFVMVESFVFPQPVRESLRMIGVNECPFVQIYRNRQCVASFTTGPVFMSRVRCTIESCTERLDESWRGL